MTMCWLVRPITQLRINNIYGYGALGKTKMLRVPQCHSVLQLNPDLWSEKTATNHLNLPYKVGSQK
jgi:hypothetical protein